MAVEEDKSAVSLVEDSVTLVENNDNKPDTAESKLAGINADSDARLKANTQQWKYHEAVPNGPGEPPNPTPVIPDVDGVQTGLFLQQFTNSVNKALHKQHCTCNGKIYTSDDLYEKSNPALFRRSKSDIDYNQSHRKTVKLPRLRSDASLVGGITNDIVEETEKPPLQVQIERESKDLQLYGMHFDPFYNNHETVYDHDGEIRLPNIMDIHDLSGNSWKIIQEPKKGRDLKYAYSRFDRKVFSDAISEADEDIKTKSAKSSKSMKRNVSAESNFSKRRLITVDISSATPNNSETEGSLRSASSDSFGLPKMEPLCNSAPAHTPQIRSPPFVCDEIGRKALLWRYASAVRKGEITYRDYLQKVSEISSLYRDENDGANGDDSKRLKRELSPQQITTDGALIKIPRADLDPDAESKVNLLQSLPSAYERQCAATVKLETSFPPELQVLYSKAGLSVSNLTDSFSKSLPENFLDKEKELLRSEYPMYDWKVRQKFQQSPLKTGERSASDTPLRSVRLAQTDGRRRTGIGPGDFGHTVKIFSNRKGLDQNVVSFRSSQVFDRHGKLIDIPETESVKKMIVGDGQSSCLSRGFPPNQPPTTPALTYASCSVPNIMETMEEEDTGQEEKKNEEKLENDESVIMEKNDIEPINAQVTNHVTRTEISTAKSQKSERSWKEGFDGKMYKVSKERRLDVVIPAPSAGKDRKVSFDSRGDEISTISDVIPPNPYNSNENIDQIGLSEDQRNKRYSVGSSSKVLPVKLLGAEDLLPDMQATGLRGTVRRKSSSRSESSKHVNDTSPRPLLNAPGFSESHKSWPVTLSTKHLVFVSPLE